MKMNDEELDQINGGTAMYGYDDEPVAYCPKCLKPVMGRRTTEDGKPVLLFHCNYCGYEYTR